MLIWLFLSTLTLTATIKYPSHAGLLVMSEAPVLSFSMPASQLNTCVFNLNKPVPACYITPSVLSTICCTDLHDTYSKREHAWSGKRVICSVYIPKVFQRAKDYFCVSEEGSQCSCGYKNSLLNLLGNQQHVKLCSISPSGLKFKPPGHVTNVKACLRGPNTAAWAFTDNMPLKKQLSGCPYSCPGANVEGSQV